MRKLFFALALVPMIAHAEWIQIDTPSRVALSPASVPQGGNPGTAGATGNGGFIDLRGTPAPGLPNGVALHIEPLVTAAPATDQAAETWTIEPNSTLQQTLVEWSQKAGWKTPKWEATNPYQVVEGIKYEGSFMDALRDVANAVPQIDITASMDKRELVVSDAPH